MKKRLVAGLAAAVAVALQGASTICLNGEWRLDYFPQPDAGAVRAVPLAVPFKTVKATVPGNCELDLVNAGILPPMEIGLNVLKLRPYEGYQWLYTKTFACPPREPGERAVLVFDGIDTLADVFLNGEKIGEAENMLIPHEFDVTDKIRAGAENTVQVLIRPVGLAAAAVSLGELGYTMSGGANHEHFRKAPHMYGWDIMPRLVSAGLWRSVNLIVKEAVSLTDVHWMTVDTDPATGFAEVFVDVQAKYPVTMVDKIMLDVSLSKDGKTVYHNNRKLPAFAWRTELSIEGHIMRLDDRFAL